MPSPAPCPPAPAASAARAVASSPGSGRSEGYLLTRHARLRCTERGVALLDVARVLDRPTFIVPGADGSVLHVGIAIDPDGYRWVVVATRPGSPASRIPVTTVWRSGLERAGLRRLRRGRSTRPSARAERRAGRQIERRSRLGEEP